MQTSVYVPVNLHKIAKETSISLSDVLEGALVEKLKERGIDLGEAASPALSPICKPPDESSEGDQR